MVHVAKISFNKDPNIGMYGLATNRFCLLGNFVPKKVIRLIEEVLKVPVIQSNVYGTSLVGIFAAASKDILLLPKVIFNYELKKIQDAADKIGVKVRLIETDNTALNNNVLCNDKIGVLSTDFTKEEAQEIANALQIRVIQKDLADMKTPGSAAVLNNKGGLFNTFLSDKDIKGMEHVFGFKINLGTINQGSPIIGSGVIANDNGLLIGELSSGYEIGRVEESLGFLNQ